MGGVTESDLSSSFSSGQFSLNEMKEATNIFEEEKVISSSNDSNFPLLSSSYRRFSIEEIIEATNNFDREKCLRRESACWEEYAAEIYAVNSNTKGLWVAVKCFREKFNHEFENEIRMVTTIEAHPNIVSLLGYCMESGQKILVYEYMKNGSLIDYVKEGSTVSLSWEQRLNICLGAAYGLQHLHKATTEFPNGMIHRDVKPSNILLDENWVAKFSDFGLSCATQSDITITARIIGTMGYLAPELVSNYQLTRKNDVYAFGNILFEVLCRKKIWDRGDVSFYINDDEDLGLWAQENVDTEIESGILSASLNAFTDAISRCMKQDFNRRPTMDGVVLLLQTALNCREGTAECEPIPTIHLNAPRESWTMGAVTDSDSYRRFSLGELVEATNCFDTKKLLRRDSYWEEYGAEIIQVNSNTDRIWAAVKRFKENYNDEFEKEIRMVTTIKAHPNIVSLLGYCMESGEKILVYKYMEKGSLSDYVREGRSTITLSWEQRLNICLTAAYGLQHLHKEMTDFPNGIIHRDVKPLNILLDENWVANFSNFGLSHAAQPNTIIIDKIQGTTGYFAPEIFISRQLTRKNDVYAFGVVMFEVLCLKNPWDRGDESYYFYDDEDLGYWAQENVDLRIKDEISSGSLNAFTKAIGRCLQRDPDKRPSMDGLVELLRTALSAPSDSRIMGGVTESDSLDEKKVMSSTDSESESDSDDRTSSLSSSYHRFSLGEIKEVTNNFDKQMVTRRGPYWIEYLAQISFDHKIIWAAVRHLKKHCRDEFENEIRAVTKIQTHLNLISLLGYCIESNEKILIYEHMEKGSLGDYVNKDGTICLSWKKRLSICLGAAYGLQHLHKETDEFRSGIIHRDVNPANLLLDENWVAKVSEFGLSHAAQINSTFEPTRGGTVGYLAPEITKSNHLTKKADVYGFGVILFQMLCQKKPCDRGDTSYNGSEDEDLGVWAQENVDIQIEESISDDSLKAFTCAIGRCLQSNPYKRLTMDRVVLLLETALNSQEDEGEPILDIDINAPRTKSRTMGEGVAKSGSSSSYSNSSFLLSSSTCRQFPLDEIEEATNNFDMKNYLGKGGEGKVYRAEIYLDSKAKKSQVAVKHLNKECTSEFEKEIVTVSKIRHPNLVSLLGYCKESDDKVLIYEYMGKGSLFDYVKKDSKVCLSWKQRLNICLGAARGLQHLHRETTENPKGIIHRDVKPENILIDENWVAKVSDFGLFKLSTAVQTMSTINTGQRGTWGYMAPESSSYLLSRKADVYAFGLVMFEVLCRQKRWDGGGDDQSVYIEENEVIGALAYDNVDVEIKDEIAYNSLVVFIDIIVASLRLDRKRRPTINEVVLNLEAALKYQDQKQ